MKIITIPHPSLRKIAQDVEKVDRKMLKLINNFEETLVNKNNPKGVGLAFPQVDILYRVFATYLADGERSDEKNSLITFINPRIVKHSQKQTFGPDDKEPTLEGCLSMPGIYGPVPRWEWVEIEFQIVDKQSDSLNLVSQNNRFDNFHARVVQHELDHLNGILFTDYSIDYDLPIYEEKGKKLVEIEDRNFLENF